MQVSVENLSELGRKLSVSLPEEKVRDKVEARLVSVAREVRLDGFRPGKVPAAIVRKRFGKQIREEEVSELLHSSFRDAIREQNLSIVGIPSITAVNADEGKGLTYVAEFDVQPEIQLQPLETLTVPRYTTSIQDADVDVVIERLRAQRKTWTPVERAAAKDDQVTFSFEGTANGENFSNGRTEGVTTVLGSGQMIDGFEDALIGSKAGDTVSVDLPFPADYGNAKLAGQTANFDIEVTLVSEGVLPEVNEDFVKALGIEEGGVDAFREDVRNNMERELTNTVNSRNKNAVFDALLAAHPFTLPESAVREEMKEMLKPYRDRVANGESVAVSEASLEERYMPVARRRVALGLLLGQLAENSQMVVDPERVKARIKLLAQSYEHPEMVEAWYQAEPERMQEIHGVVMEDQLLDLILSKARVDEQSLSFDEATRVPAAGETV